MGLREKVVSLSLSVAMVLGSIPIANVSAEGVRLRKEDDALYHPELEFASNSQQFYDDLVTETDKIHEFGKMPTLEELEAMSGYSSSKVTLTTFREQYGSGSAFVAPTGDVLIYLLNSDELVLLSDLVNNVAEGETAEEQQYYSMAHYVLGTSISMPSTLTVYKPIGTAEHPFGGIFDGDSFEVSGIIMNGVAPDTYDTGYFGMFGYTSATAEIRRLGVTNTTITLPYVVASDVGVLCGRNGGLIEDCYVNNRSSTKVRVSNSTAGGITAENYGTVRRCYVDAFVDVDVDAGAYSEPQPIATVNHDGGTVEVDTCYYCRWTDSSYFINTNASDMTADNGDIPCIYGWKYLGDTSQILGTGLYYKDFVDAKMPGTSFKSGSYEFRVYSQFYTVGSYYYRLRELPNLLGEGDKFDSEIASYVKSKLSFALVDEDDWKLLVQKNNKRGNTSDEEQQFYSTLTVYIVGKNTDGKVVYGSKSAHILDISASIEPLGTDEYPFNGTIPSGYGVPDSMIRFHLGTGVQSPLFGTLGAKASVDCFAWYGPFPAFQVDGYLNPAEFIDNGYRGIIVNKLMSGSKFGVHVLDSTNYAGGNVSGHLYMDKGCDYYRSHEAEIESYDWDELGIIGYCYGRVDDAGFALGYEVQSEDGGIEFTNYFISNYTKTVLNGTTGKRVSSDTSSNKYVKDYNASVDYLKGYDLSPSVYSINSYWRPSGVKGVMIDTYPTLMKPDADAEGVLLIDSASNFLWLISYATGQRARLTHSLDLRYLQLSGNGRNGRYSLDGTRPSSDTDDISNYISINAVRDCYALLGLSIKDGAVTQYNYSNDYSVDWSNLYLVGWKFTGTTNSNSYVNILCTNMENVHYSMDITLRNLGGVTGHGGSNTTYYSSMCHTASYCSNRCDVYHYMNRWVYFYCMGYTNTQCTTYNTCKDTEYTASLLYANLGYTNTYCLTRATSESTKQFRDGYNTRNGTDRIMGLGYQCTYCKSDWVYDFTGTLSFLVFGENMSKCVFSGKYTGRYKDGYMNCLAKSECFDSYITDGAEITCGFDGLSWYNAKRNLVMGTFNVLFGTSFLYLIRSGSDNTVLADINFVALDSTKSESTFSYDVLIGATTVVPSSSGTLMDGSNTHYGGTVHFINEDGSVLKNITTNSNIVFMSNGTNYSDIDFGDLGYMEKFYLSDGVMINYGDIRGTVQTSLRYFRVSRGVNSINFGDISLFNPRFGGDYLIVCDRDSKNYGNVDIGVTLDNYTDGTFRLYISQRDSANSSNNYGDVRVHGVGRQAVIGGIELVYASGANYGDIRIDNLKMNYFTSYGGCGNYGSFMIEDCDMKGCTVCRLYQYVVGETPIYYDMGSYTIRNSTIRGTLRIYDGQYLRYSTDYVTVIRRDDRITIENLHFDSGYSSLDITSFESGGGRILDWQNTEHISVKNVTGSPKLYYSGMGTGVGREHSYDLILDGVLEIDGCQLKMFDLAMTDRMGACISTHRNNMDFVVKNTTIQDVSKISGITRNNYSKWYPTCYATGDIYADISGADVHVVGIGNGGATTYRTTNTALMHSGDIYVKSPNKIYVSGLVEGDGTETFVYNGVQGGDIVIDTEPTTEVYVSGISMSVPKVSAVENIGNITIRGTGKAMKIVPISSEVRELRTSANYGDVLADSSVTVQYEGYAKYIANAVSAYGINYGTFSDANADRDGVNNATKVAYLIDLSGRKGVHPDTAYVYSTDTSMTSVVHTADVAFNTFGEAIEGMDVETSLTSTIDRVVTYADVVAPQFGLRYNNPLATEYITATTKRMYNGDNGLEYGDVGSLRGVLKETVEGYSGDGGFMLTAFGSDGDNRLGLGLDRLFYINNDYSSKPEWWSDVAYKGMTFEEYMDGIVRQSVGGTWAEINDITLKSVDMYETKDGETDYIATRSSLIPFQATIDADGDGVYHNKVIVTVADLYVVMNAFKDVTSNPVEWIPTTTYSYGGTVHYFAEPMIYADAQAFLNGIKSLVSDENALLLSDSYSSTGTVSLQLEEDGGIRYALIGVVTSEDGLHQNLIALKLHSVSNSPLGFVVGFSYPTGYQRSSGYDVTDAFGKGYSYYNDVNRFTPTESDKFTVEEGVQHTETWGDLRYPIYNMTVNMSHTSDGGTTWTNETANPYFRTVLLSFKSRNIVKVKTIVSDGIKSYSFEENCTSDGEATKDGINTIKFNDSNLTDDIFKTDSGVQMTTALNDNNPLFRGGDKQFRVVGYTDNNDEIVLFEIRVHKNTSFENYIRNRGVFPRCWWGADDASTEVTENVAVSPTTLVGYYNQRYYVFSTLSNAVYNGVEYEGRIEHGEVSYPAVVKRSWTVTAENGDVATYVLNDKLNDIDHLDLYAIRLDGLATIGNSYLMSGNSFYAYLRAYTNGSDVSGDVSGVVGYESMNLGLYNIYRVEKYRDGVYDGDLRFKDDERFYFSNTGSGRTARDDETGIEFTVSNSGWYNGLYWHSTDVAKVDMPDNILTYRVYVRLLLEDGSYATMRLSDVNFQKALRSEHDLLEATATNKIVTTTISTHPNEVDDLVDIDENGVIGYSSTPEGVGQLYIVDSFEPNAVSSSVGYRISNFAKLQKLDGSGNWVTVFESGGTDAVYRYTQTFEDGLGGGITNKFRILAQDYSTADAEKATHVTYFDHTFYAVTRNKDVQIVFKTDDAVTMALYNEIIANDGSLAVQIKNMNGSQAVIQQTKMYYNNSDMESTFYKLSQGDFAVDVQVPVGYTPKVRIIGTSTEGWLQDSPVVRGKRIRLPYPNAQTYRLEMYLERNETYPVWGVEGYKSTYKVELNNHV